MGYILSMKEEDSRHRPFSDLSDFLKKRQIPLKQFKEETPEPFADETPISFSEIMKDVKALEQEKNRVGAVKQPLPIRLPEAEDLEDILEDVIERSGFNVVNLPEYMEGYVEGINPLTLEKLRAGEFSVQASLDLHGYAIDVAQELFEAFIHKAAGSGFACIKVIHGRGLKSKGEPVLKERLKEWILRAMHRKWVLAFASCKMCEGGPGATCIMLRKRPQKKRMRIIG
jgi:DNA-nicking Smr family endonuclease